LCAKVRLLFQITKFSGIYFEIYRRGRVKTGMINVFRQTAGDGAMVAASDASCFGEKLAPILYSLRSPEAKGAAWPLSFRVNLIFLNLQNSSFQGRFTEKRIFFRFLSKKWWKVVESGEIFVSLQSK